MNIVLIILAVLAGLIGVLLIAALLIKNEYSIHREVLINRPRHEVFEYARHLKNQERWSKWVMQDPNMKKEFRGTDGDVGFVYGWNGNKDAGEGEQEITNLADNERIDVEIRFKRPFVQTAQTPMVLSSEGTQTRVRWGMDGRMDYPMNLMTAMVAGMLKKDMDTSLGNLKRILEQK